MFSWKPLYSYIRQFRRMLRSRLLLILLVVMLGVIAIGMYSLDSQTTLHTKQKIIAKFDQSQFQVVPDDDEETNTGINVDEDEDDALVSIKRKKKEKRKKVRDEGEDYVVDTNQIMAGEEDRKSQEEEQEVDEENEQEETSLLKKLKLEIQEEKRKLNEQWEEFETEERRLKKMSEDVEKKMKMADRDLKVEKQFLQDEKQQWKYERERLEKNDVLRRDDDGKTTKEPIIDGLNSTVIRRKFPGLTLLPDYKLEQFLTPDPRTGKERTLEDMSEYEAEERFYSLVSSRHINCADMRRMGNSGDGGWDICESEPFKPKKDCLVYSFGINFDFSFDDAMGDKYSCNVISFDPSMQSYDHARNDHVMFVALGLGERDEVNGEGWKLQTLATILQTTHHSQSVIDVLKLDIEYNEWSCFKTLFKQGILQQVKQLMFEIHTPKLLDRNPSVKDYSDMAETLLEIERLGFRRFHSHPNPLSPYMSPVTGKIRRCCYELYYVNLKFIL